MCRGLPLDGLGVAPSANNTKATSQQACSSARPPQYDDVFLQFTYKVVPCDKTYRHDYATCPFSHPGESSERRHPSTYLPFMCGSTQHSTDLKEKCPFGAACKYAHGHFELWLHPGRFRTKMCSLGEKCKRPVCFFAHSEQEMRVTPYSKLDTAAAVAAQQLAQLQGESSLCNVELVNRTSSTCSSTDSDRKLAVTTHSSPCGSEIGLNVQSRGSSCNSVAAADDGCSRLTAGILNNQAAMLEMQLQSNALALSVTDMGVAADAGAAAALTSAPGLWLAGNTSMMQPTIPLAGCNTALSTLGLQSQQIQQQQQLMMLDSAARFSTYTQAQMPPAAITSGLGDPWLLPAHMAAAAASNRLAEQYAANRMILQQRQAALDSFAGLTACKLPSVANPSMFGTSGLDQWLQMDNVYGAAPGLSRPAVGCSFSQPVQDAGAAGMAQLLSALPDQTVQQLLGMLTVEPQA